MINRNRADCDMEQSVIGDFRLWHNRSINIILYSIIIKHFTDNSSFSMLICMKCVLVCFDVLKVFLFALCEVSNINCL